MNDDVSDIRERFTMQDDISAWACDCIVSLSIVCEESYPVKPDSKELAYAIHERDNEIDRLRQRLAEVGGGLPQWLDPTTPNGDPRHDHDYRVGWNDCRDAMISAYSAAEQRGRRLRLAETEQEDRK